MIIGNAPVARCGSIEALHELDECEHADLIFTKTMLWKNEGTTGKTYYYNALLKTSCNRVGLKCLGWSEYWREGLFERGWSKPVVISVYPECLDIMRDVVKNNKYAVHDTFIGDRFAIELNISCVNHKYNDVHEMLKTVFSEVDFGETKVGLKVDHKVDIEWLDAVVRKYGIAWLTAINTRFGRLNGVVGGIGGALLKHDAIEVVSKLVDIAPVIACGGVFSRDDAAAYITLGARAVIIGTWYQEDGVDVFKNIKIAESKL